MVKCLNLINNKPGFSDGEVIDTIVGNKYVVALGLDFGIEMEFLYVSSDGFNDCNLHGLLLGDSLGSTDDTALVSI